MTHTSSSSAATHVHTEAIKAQFGIQLPPSTDIYDAIMGSIEPELLSINIPRLNSYYQQETPAQRTQRMSRYRKAYALYQKRYNEWITKLKQLLQDMQKEALKVAEVKTMELEQQALDTFDARFDMVA